MVDIRIDVYFVATLFIRADEIHLSKIKHVESLTSHNSNIPILIKEATGVPACIP